MQMTTTEEISVKKNPLLAGFLSFMFAPVGFLYLGNMTLFWQFLFYYLIALVLPVLAPNLFTYLFSYGTLLLILLSSVISSVYLSMKGKDVRKLSNAQKISIPLILIGSITFNVFGIPYWAEAKGYSHYSIPSGSMLPTLRIGSYIFVKTIKHEKPIHGDIVVFQYPEDLSIKFVMRIIALPGDTLEYRNKRVFINGQERPIIKVDSKEGYSLPPLTEEGLEVFDGRSHKIWRKITAGRDFGPILIPEGKYFVMGDNRDNSNDSRVWGFLDRELIQQQVEYSFHFDDLQFTPVD